VGAQEVRWDRGGTEQAGDFTCFYRKGNEYREVAIGLFVHNKMESRDKGVGFVNDRG
jgi:hypothetical protein